MRRSMLLHSLHAISLMLFVSFLFFLDLVRIGLKLVDSVLGWFLVYQSQLQAIFWDCNKRFELQEILDVSIQWIVILHAFYWIIKKLFGNFVIIPEVTLIKIIHLVIKSTVTFLLFFKMVELLHFCKRHFTNLLLWLTVTHQITNWFSNINQFVSLVLHLKGSSRSWLQLSLVPFLLGFRLFSLKLLFHFGVNLILQSFDFTSLFVGVLLSFAFAGARFPFQFLLNVFDRCHWLLHNIFLDLLVVLEHTVPRLGLILVRPRFYQAILITALNSRVVTRG